MFFSAYGSVLNVFVVQFRHLSRKRREIRSHHVVVQKFATATTLLYDDLALEYWSRQRDGDEFYTCGSHVWNYFGGAPPPPGDHGALRRC